MAHLYYDQNPDEIATAYDVPLASVYVALAYYYEHRADIDVDSLCAIMSEKN